MYDSKSRPQRSWPIVDRLDEWAGRRGNILGALYKSLAGGRTTAVDVVLIRRSFEGGRWRGTLMHEEQIALLAESKLLREDLSSGNLAIVLVARDSLTFTAPVNYAGGRYRLHVRAHVIDPVTLAESGLEDVEAALLAHFQRGKAVGSVDTGVGTTQGAVDLGRDFKKKPPRLPGIMLELQVVEPLVEFQGSVHFPWREFNDSTRSLPADWSVREELDNDFEAAEQIRSAMRQQEPTALSGVIYVSGDDGTAVKEAVARLAKAYGYRLENDGEPQPGSWWQRVKAIFGGSEPLDPVPDFRLADQAMHASAIARMRRDEEDRLQLLALNVIDALKGQQEAVVHLDRLLVVKIGSKLLVRTLSPAQVTALEMNENLYTKPRVLYAALLHPDEWKHLWTPPRPAPAERRRLRGVRRTSPDL